MSETYATVRTETCLAYRAHRGSRAIIKVIVDTFGGHPYVIYHVKFLVEDGSYTTASVYEHDQFEAALTQYNEYLVDLARLD